MFFPPSVLRNRQAYVEGVSVGIWYVFRFLRADIWTPAKEIEDGGGQRRERKLSHPPSSVFFFFFHSRPDFRAFKQRKTHKAFAQARTENRQSDIPQHDIPL